MATTRVSSTKSRSISPRRPKPPKGRKVSDDFRAVARRLECDDDKERFEAKLRKIAKAPTKQKSER